MQVIQKARQQGKTTELIMKSAENKSQIVCPSLKDARIIVEQAERMGLDIPLPIPFDDFLKGNFVGKKINAFQIDNADMLLNRLARGIKIESITIDHDS